MLVYKSVQSLIQQRFLFGITLYILSDRETCSAHFYYYFILFSHSAVQNKCPQSLVLARTRAILQFTDKN